MQEMCGYQISCPFSSWTHIHFGLPRRRFLSPPARLFFLVGLLLAQFSHCSHVRLLGIRGTRSVLAHTVQQRWTAGVALVGRGGEGGGRGEHKRRIFSGWLVGLDVCLPRSRRQGRVRFRCSCVTQINVLTDITHRSSRAPVNFLPN